MFGLKGPQMQHDMKRYDPHFALELAVKDIRLAEAMAKEHGVGMSVSNTANRTLFHSFCSSVAVPLAF